MAILAFDLTDKRSLDKLRETFIPLLEDSVVNCLTVVTGTKLDLVSTNGRQVKSSEGCDLAEQLHTTQVELALKRNSNTYLKGLDPRKLYFETSSKTGDGVEELFERVQSILIPHLRKTVPKNSKAMFKSGGGVTVLDSEPPAGKSRCCGGSSD